MLCCDINSIFLAEVKKLRTHLDLLREEYVKLQTRLADVERKYQMSLASLGQSDAEHNDNFVSRLLSTVAELFDKELYRYLKVIHFIAFINILYEVHHSDKGIYLDVLYNTTFTRCKTCNVLMC